MAKTRLLEKDIYAFYCSDSGAVVTEGGEVVVAKSSSGSFMGDGANEDGRVASMAAKYFLTVEVSTCLSCLLSRQVPKVLPEV